MSSAVRQRNRARRRASDDFLKKEHDEGATDSRGTDATLLTPIHWAFVFVVFAAFLVALDHLHHRLPTPRSPNDDDSRFSEERAVGILNELSDFGWKPAGSFVCEELTRNRILEEIRSIKTTSNAEKLGVKFDVDTQYVSSCFEIPTHDVDGFSMCYRNRLAYPIGKIEVSNVMAKLGRTDGDEASTVAVLLNCHYDSWPTSSAGSDDLSSCALMLELMRIYAKKPDLLRHDVIFLFNGAEESSLLAAHGFITQHPWRHQIRAFINLEASGSGGRELLFQAGPANEWLLNSYLEAAVHPHCSVIGQEVFQSGVYPGDTDFRVFRDHGRIPGLDMAFVQNAYWWHTEFDEAKRIRPGSLQRAGENVLATLNHLLESPYLVKPAEYANRKTVFFDFLGMFVVIYSLSLANVVSILATAAVFVGTWWSSRRRGSLYLLAVRDYTIVLGLMLLTVYVMAYMSLFTYGAMRWYTRHWLALVAYGLPCVWAGLSVQGLLTARIAANQRGIYAAALESVHLVAVSLVLLVFTYYNIASGFLFALLLIPLLKKLLGELVVLDAWPNVLLTLAVTLPGTSMCMYTSQMLLSIFIPIMGRTSANPEPIVAAFVAFSAIVVVLSLNGLVAKTRNGRPSEDATNLGLVYVVGGVLLSTLTVLYVFASLWPSPFRFQELYPTAKRTQFFHVNQALYDRDGVLAVNETRFYAISHDYRGAEDIPFVRADANYTLLSCHYPNNPYCEVPYYFPTRHRVKQRHIRTKVAEERLKFEKATTIVQTGRKRVDAAGVPRIEYAFTVAGTGQMSVYVIPDEGWAVLDASVASTPASPQPHLFIYLTCSSPLNHCQWTFTVTIENKEIQRAGEERPLLVGVSSHYLHGPQMQSDTIKHMLGAIEQNRLASAEWTITASAWNVDQVYKHF